MKKFIFSAIAAIGLLLSPSCSDENEALSGSGNEALVSFSVNLADGVSTKADPATVIGDGTTAKELYVRVFDDGGTLIDGLSNQTYDISGKSTTVNLNLVKGKTYKFLFWAQSGETNAFSFDGTTVKVSYANAEANDEKRDAFYAVKTKTVTGSFQEEVTLYRPFAQLNFLTTAEDIKAAINAGQRVEKTSITVASAAKALTPDSSFDPDEKPSVSDAAENVLFNFAKVPFTVEGNTVSSPSCLWIKDGKVKETQEEGADKYFYLATTYFLVNNAADATAQIVLADVNMKVYGAEGDGLKVQSVPVCMNYRTNIYGNLLTASGTYHVTIDENFNRPQLPGQDIEITEQEVASEAEVVEAFENGASKVTLTEALPSTNSTGIIPQAYADRNTDVIELVLEKPITPGYVFTYKEPEQGATNTSAPATVYITIPESAGSSTITESNIRLPQSTVYVNGVKVTTMTAETSSNTLVVGPGTEITNLKVKAGNVRIMNGGKVTNIERHDEADATIPTYVTIVTGGELTNTPEDEKIIITYEDATAGNVVLNGVYSFNTVKEAVAYAASKNISDVKLVLADATYNEVISVPNGMTLSIDSESGTASNVVLDGQLAILGNSGVINLKNITISRSNASDDVTDISQTENSAIALWHTGIVNCDNVIFENLATNATAITSWWSTGAGTQINVKNSTFNCGGQRPIRSDANVTVEGCTFNDPYRYAVQMTSKASTMSAENAVVNFKNNTINAGSTTDKPVYGIQLEGETYGCSHLIINGSGNTIDLGSTGKTGTMYYCECGKVDHATIQWNVETAIVHAENYITTKDELIAFAKAVNEEGKTFAHQYVFLGADIDLENEAWEPIGQTGGGRTSFQGIFDGQGFTIKNLKVDTSAETGEYFASGLFGWLEAHNSSYNPIIKNLTVDGAEIKGHNYCGVIGGYIDGGSTFSLLNCTVKNADVSAQYYDNDADGNKAGALVGYAGPGCQNITNCRAIDCTVDAVRDAGQLIGCTYTNKTTITNCTATNVTVSNNSTAPEDYAKNNQNIQEDIVGRPLILQQQ